MTDDSTTRVVRVTIEREFEVPEDILTDGDATEEELDERALDYFWSYWSEFLGQRPIRKEDIREAKTT